MKYLEFEKRGCNFFPGDKDNEESDIGNYRICTPGEIVPLKDGRMMLFEFGCYDRQIWRYHNKGELYHVYLYRNFERACKVERQNRQCQNHRE